MLFKLIAGWFSGEGIGSLIQNFMGMMSPEKQQQNSAPAQIPSTQQQAAQTVQSPTGTAQIGEAPSTLAAYNTSNMNLVDYLANATKMQSQPPIPYKADFVSPTQTPVNAEQNKSQVAQR